jgi:hypothetical protein
MPMFSASIVLHGPASIPTSGGGSCASLGGGPFGHVDPIEPRSQCHHPSDPHEHSQSCSHVEISHVAPAPLHGTDCDVSKNGHVLQNHVPREQLHCPGGGGPEHSPLFV